MGNDLISREAALEICQKEYEERLKMLDYCGDTVAWNIGNAIKMLPAVNAAPVVHGHVLDSDNPFCGPCSACGESVNRKWHYCPNCGAKMDGGEENDRPTGN